MISILVAASPRPREGRLSLARKYSPIPCLDVTFSQCRCLPSARVGDFSAKSVQYPYAEVRRRVLYATIYNLWGSASRLQVR